jgi:hypothetical protein
VKLGVLLSPQTLELVYFPPPKIAYHRGCFLMLELDDHRRCCRLLLTFRESFEFPLLKNNKLQQRFNSLQFNYFLELGG